MTIEFSYISEIIDNKETNRREKKYSIDLTFLNDKKNIVISIYPAFCSDYYIRGCRAERFGNDGWSRFQNMYTSGRLMFQICYADDNKEINGLVFGEMGKEIMYYFSK